LTSSVGSLTFKGPSGFSGQAGTNTIFPASGIHQGEYWAYTEENGCRSDTIRLAIIVNSLPEPVITGDTLICANDSIMLDAGSGFTAYSWSQGAFTQTIKAGKGTYSVEVTDVNGCKNSDQITITEKDIVAFYSLSPASKLVPLNSKIIFSDSSSFPDDFPPVSHFWDFGDGNQANGSEASHQYALPGTYTVTYIVENALGCADTISFEITVFEQIIIPNAFSPNGDLQNDFFVIQYLEIYPNPALTIYNRWGRKVYSSENYQNNWDGDGLPDGTYFYILEIPEPKNKFTGTVYISGNGS
jgi:gliding motility-associated-like protein